jgi:hypothetical protein
VTQVDFSFTIGSEDRESFISGANWPIVVCKPPDRAVTDEEMVWSMIDLAAVIARHMEPHGLLLDLRDNKKGITPKQRRILTNAIKPGPDNVAPGGVGVAMVFTSKLLEGMLNAIFWISKPPMPTKVFNSAGEGQRWLREGLADAPRYDPDNAAHQATLYAMATNGPRYARANGLLDTEDLLASEIRAAERWPAVSR